MAFLILVGDTMEEGLALIRTLVRVVVEQMYVHQRMMSRLGLSLVVEAAGGKVGTTEGTAVAYLEAMG